MYTAVNLNTRTFFNIVSIIDLFRYNLDQEAVLDNVLYTRAYTRFVHGVKKKH